MTTVGATSPLRILLVLPSLGNGGQERQVTELSIGLAASGHHVDVVVGYPGHYYEDHLNRNGVDVIPLMARPRQDDTLPIHIRAFDAIRRLQALRRLITRNRYDIVHGYGDSSNAYISVAAGLRHRYVQIWGIRASTRTGSPLLSKALPLLSRRVDLILANSNAGADYMRSIGCRPRSYDVIPNGIDTERCDIDPDARIAIRAELGIPDDQPLVGWIGRFHPDKGVPILIEAAARLDPALNCRFLLIGGDGWGLRQEYEEQAAALGLGDRMIFHDLVKDAERYMNALDVLVSASHTEGFSNVLAEGMACGVSCVATDVGDSRSILGDLGEIVPPGNPAALADAMTKTLTHPRIDRERIRGAITGAFTIPHLVARTEATFRRVLDAR